MLTASAKLEVLCAQGGFENEEVEVDLRRRRWQRGERVGGVQRGLGGGSRRGDAGRGMGNGWKGFVDVKGGGALDDLVELSFRHGRELIWRGQGEEGVDVIAPRLTAIELAWLM